MNNKLYIATLGLVTLGSQLPAADLSKHVFEKDFFKETTDSFEKNLHPKVQGAWTSIYKTSYRHVQGGFIVEDEPKKEETPESTPELPPNLPPGFHPMAKRTPMPKHTFMGSPLLETVFNFDGNRLDAVLYNVYNKGDSPKRLTMSQLSAKIDKIRDAISEKLGVKEKFVAEKGSTEKKSYFWFKDHRVYRLDYSSTEKIKGSETPEYLTLLIEDRTGESTALNPITKILTGSKLKAKVVKKANGDVYIDNFPMVDQGQKGYCACATVARILDYYGRDRNQHEIAKLAEADGGGTNPDVLLKMMRRIRTKLKLKYNSIYDLDKAGKNILRSYKKVNGSVPNGTRADWTLLVREYGGLAPSNPEAYLEACRITPELKKFKANIILNINKGIPIAWGLMLGLYAEEGKVPQNGGGHMRTIVGYNKKEDCLIFSDSWGKGHELKKMNFDNAFAATMGLHLIAPK